MSNLRSFSLALLLLTGCAAETTGATALEADATDAPVFTEQAVNVDQRFSDAVTVRDGSLVVPTSMLGKIEIGSVVAGDRSSKPGSANPYGFLRRVTNIESNGKTTTLVTQKAELGEWLAAGHLDFERSRGLFDGARVDRSSITMKTVHLLDKSEASGTGSGDGAVAGNLKDEIRIEDVAVKISASYDGYIDIHRHFGIPTSFEMESQLTLTPEVAARIVWKISNQASVEGSLKGAEVLVPLTTPIPMTVRYTPELKCNLSASGEAQITLGANASATAVVGFEAHGGLTDLPNVDNRSQAPTATASLQLVEVTGKATVSTECEIVGNVELLAFDSVGFTGRLGPWLNLTATACANANAGGVNAGFTLQESHGFTETFSAKIQVPGIGGLEKTQELWSGKQTIGQGYLAGDETTCDLPSVDSCAGKTDGFHCSEVAAYSGIVCQGGQIAKGLQCKSTSQKCTGGNANAITCQ